MATGTLIVFGALGLARFGYTMLLPSMQDSLHLDNTQTGGLATANMIGYLAFCVAGGALASRFGARVVASVGLAVSCAGMLLTGLAAGFGSACSWRLVTGIGSGGTNVPVMGLVAAWFGKKRRGLATGIAVTGSSIGLIFSGWLVPWVLARYGSYGWRVCWIVFAAVAFLLMVLAMTVLRNRPAELGLDLCGAGEEDRAPSTGGQRLSWKSVYRSGIVWHVGITYLAFGFSYIIYMTFFSKYLVSVGHYTQKQAGGLFAVMGWLSLLCGLIWGWVSDLIGRKGALIIVFCLHAAAFMLFALWRAPGGFLLSAVLFGISAWSIPGIMAALCGDLLGPRLGPAGLGFVTLFMGIGQAAGPATAGVIADNAGGLPAALLLAGGVALAGALSAATLHGPSMENRIGAKAVPGTETVRAGGKLPGEE